MTDPTQSHEAPANAVEAAESTTHEAVLPSPSPTAEAPETPAAQASQEPTEGPSTEGPSTEGPGAASEPAAAADAAPAAPSAEPADDGVSDEGDADGEAEAGAEGDASAAESEVEGGAKKKRRRRRRKKGAAQAAGDKPSEGEAAAGPAKDAPGGVFARFFDASGGLKKHAFQVGEVIAGRVQSANEGAFAVDLFGKAVAYVDIFEPREVPVIVEPEPAEAGSAAAEAKPETTSPEAASEAGAEAAASGEATAPGGEAASSEAASAPEAPASEPGEAAASAPEAPASEPGEAAPVPEPEPAAHATPASEAVEVEPVAAAEAPPEAAVADAASEADLAAHDHHAEEHSAEPEPEPEPPPAPALGELFRGRIGAVAESGHMVVVNRIVDVAAAKAKLEGARVHKRRVRGVVFGFNRGGFDVLVEGLRVFCPASGMALASIDDPHEFLGRRLEFTLPPAKSGTHGFVVSRRGILERAQRKAARALFKSLEVGQQIHGRVTQVREFGVFVDLGGIEGLVHQSELSFSRGIKPADVAKVGQEVDVKVLKIGGDGPSRRDRERVSLSIKALLDDPWSEHKALLEPGTVRTGKVVRATDFGAFVELAPMIEGLLHISELGKELTHASQAVKEGDELRVVIERVDSKMRRISLSALSAAEEKALEEAGTEKVRLPKPGQQIEVVVDKVEHAGLVVQVPGVFGRRGRGFIPNSEMGTERGTDHRRGFPTGTKLTVKVIGADRDGGLRCSRKALLVDEEKRAVQDYRREAARQGLGTFGDLLRAKLEGSTK